mmetsp:Transcript_6055/g.37531  ORF Transcript_6055/g.37531 Transcript_6055/m.37531 type:complete len:205 (-) Transcript_6055:570-1184(-)
MGKAIITLSSSNASESVCPGCTAYNFTQMMCIPNVVMPSKNAQNRYSRTNARTKGGASWCKRVVPKMRSRGVMMSLSVTLADVPTAEVKQDTTITSVATAKTIPNSLLRKIVADMTNLWHHPRYADSLNRFIFRVMICSLPCKWSSSLSVWLTSRLSSFMACSSSSSILFCITLRYSSSSSICPCTPFDPNTSPCGRATNPCVA